MDASARDVLDFWFGDGNVARGEWFRKDAGFDAQIRARFGALVERALAGALDGWADGGADAALARVLLLDQFTRNIFRDTARAFEGDASALAATRRLVAYGLDLQLAPLRRVFAYLPLEHAEDRAAQRLSIALFAALVVEDPALAPYADYAQRHSAVIERFGRFPHRNAIVGRANTADEIEFLKQPGSGF
ncbi:MAG: DUF924 domain-containing protein [Aquincola sp.]|nr:DUF924 domain-containing protein [Aquincola sp.]